jgi:hypothetical protein
MTDTTKGKVLKELRPRPDLHYEICEGAGEYAGAYVGYCNDEIEVAAGTPFDVLTGLQHKFKHQCNVIDLEAARGNRKR